MLAMTQSVKHNESAFELHRGAYTVRLARTRDEYVQALQLRFRVFNLELNEGLQASYATGRDEDQFDAACDHLIAIHNATHAVVGTYRLQTSEQAMVGSGFYTATEFDISALSTEITSNAIELGRACIAQSDRTPFVLLLLWQGIAAYARLTGKRYLFGCCSLNSQSPDEGWQVWNHLHQNQKLHPTLSIKPLEQFVCLPTQGISESQPLPRLFRTYLRYGAQVCSPPALDRTFKTIDFLTLMDIESLDPQARSLFMDE